MRACRDRAASGRLAADGILLVDDGLSLAAAAGRISGMPFVDRQRTAKDLGELMVVAHAVVAAEAGNTITVLIDEGAGTRMAVAEKNRLGRLKANG